MSISSRSRVFAALAMAFAFGSSMAAPKDAVQGRIIVEARAGLSDDALETILKPHGGQKRKLGQSRLYVVNLPANASEVAVVNALMRNPGIKSAEVDRMVKINATSNDPYLGNEWHLAKVGAQTAWDSTRGAGVTIAILDSGVLTTHPDLVANLLPGYNEVDLNTNVADVCGHGTAVAGVSAAVFNNATGVAGVAGESKILPIRIATYDSTNGCYGYYSTIANGLTYAADHGARVANVSYGGVAGSSSIMSAAAYMKSKGGLVFVSAGNNNIDENITTDGSMIVVSATDSNDAKASFSSWGNFVSLSAPGTYIWTTNNSGGYSQWQGTSFSSPLAAGVAALMMSARPDLTNTQIQNLMFSSAVDLGAAGRDPVFGYGRVDAAAAVQAAINYVTPPDTTAPTASIAQMQSTVWGIVPVTVSASDNVGVARVDLLVNGTVVATDTASPYSFSWDTAGTANGTAVLKAIAYDAAGNAGQSSQVTVTVSNVTTSVPNDTTPPSVAITNPVSGMVNGNVSISVSASDNAGAAGIKMTLAIDGVIKAQGTGGSLGYNWNTKKGVATGSHTITATARDAAGNASSTSVNVTTR